jgi:hypothetical protein
MLRILFLSNFSLLEKHVLSGEELVIDALIHYLENLDILFKAVDHSRVINFALDPLAGGSLLLFLVTQLNVSGELGKILLEHFGDHISPSLAGLQALFGLDDSIDAIDARVLMSDVIIGREGVFAFLFLSPFVLGFDGLLCLLGQAETLLVHARLDTLLHLEASHDIHLHRLRQPVQFFVQLLDLPLSFFLFSSRLRSLRALWLLLLLLLRFSGRIHDYLYLRLYYYY